jgi:Ca-activated chloride channel family protein
VILLTDGMNNAGKVQPTLAAQAAAAADVKVYTIGVGSEGQAMVPVTDDRGATRRVMTRVDVDEPTLRKIAQTTGGRFFRATDTDSLRHVYADIDRMEKTTRSIARESTRQERFQWPALLGLALLGLNLLGGLVMRPQVP